MSKTKQTGPLAPVQLPVFEYKGQLVADSRDVAAMMERQHKDLVRSIRTYCEHLSRRKIAPAKFFIEATYIDEQGKERPNYLLTEMGCEFVANKSTGEKGAVFTARYVESFHMMKEELARRRELRAIGKPIRRSLTDAIRDSGENERMKGHAFSAYTNFALTRATGKTARQLRRERDSSKDTKAVDLLTAAELETYQRMEAAVTVLLDAGMIYDDIKAALSREEAHA